MKELYIPIVASALMMIMAAYVKSVVDRVMERIESTNERMTTLIDATNARITEHVNYCTKISKERLDERLETAEQEIERVRKFAHWVGNCLAVIGAKLEVNLPARPE